MPHLLRPLVVLLTLPLWLLASGCSGTRPAPGCDALVLDLGRGTLNGLAPTASMDEVKAQFPCSTGETEEGSEFNFGGGVYFLDHDFYAYTHRDFFEVRQRFAGRTEPALLGEPLASATAAFGEPARVDGSASLYERPWGCLRVETSGGEAVTELGVHAGSCASLEVPR